MSQVRYDARGHGRSGKPSDAEAYASAHYAEDFLAVAHAFRLNKPVFVGWSVLPLTTHSVGIDADLASQESRLCALINPPAFSTLCAHDISPQRL